MFRRGPLRRAARLMRPRPMVVLEDRPRQLLRQANLHMERGEYHRAAEMFENLGRGAEARGMLQRAPHLYLQSSRAQLLAGQIAPAMDLLRHGLKLLADSGRWPAVHQSASQAIAELQRLGYVEQASQIQAWLDQTVKAHPQAAAAPAQTASAPRPRLPAKCPFCGASVRPDEVEWLDENTAECPYCGSSVLEEGPARPV
mgnify:CR=1 FL=1